MIMTSGSTMMTVRRPMGHLGEVVLRLPYLRKLGDGTIGHMDSSGQGNRNSRGAIRRKTHSTLGGMSGVALTMLVMTNKNGVEATVGDTRGCEFRILKLISGFLIGRR
jgi:hypothetical protein